jgi:hypothetical protein
MAASATSADRLCQDRNGKVIWRADNRACTGCNMPQWDGQPMPRLRLRGRQALDARTAYQVVHMLEGVVVRGTAETLHDLGLPLFGKTGTTTGPTNVWFVGGSPDIVGGVYMGYDQPRSLGGYAQGGGFAAPMFRSSCWPRAIAGIIRRSCAAGRPHGQDRSRFGQARVRRHAQDEAKAAVIWEAFKPDTEPTRVTRQEQVVAKRRNCSTRSGAVSTPFRARATRATSRGTSRGSGRGLLNLSGDERRWTDSRARHIVAGMTNRRAALALFAAIAMPAGAAHAELAEGVLAPAFVTQGARAGKPFTFDLKAALKKGSVVLYFFPKVFTQGCTLEAHAFAEAIGDYQKAGATVIGLSADDIGSLAKFSTLECRDKFPWA